MLNSTQNLKRINKMRIKIEQAMGRGRTNRLATRVNGEFDSPHVTIAVGIVVHCARFVTGHVLSFCTFRVC